MGFNKQAEYQQAGYKGMERFDITLRVIESIDLMGDFYTKLRFKGINEESAFIYELFINSFFKIFHITASMLTKDDIDLIVEVETAFKGEIALSPETANLFLDLFENYLHAMKKAGVYDPAIVRQFINPAAAYEASI